MSKGADDEPLAVRCGCIVRLTSLDRVLAKAPPKMPPGADHSGGSTRSANRLPVMVYTLHPIAKGGRDANVPHVD